jgi:hypothetical protein
LSVDSCTHCYSSRTCIQLFSFKRRSSLTRRLAFTLFLVIACTGRALAQSSSPSQPASFAQISLGHSVVALNGPWKFHIGNSPLDPVTHAPLWANPSFDDSTWETVDLTPKTVSFDPIGGNPGYVPGWTTRGHPGISGYGWYRIRVRIETQPGEGLAVAGPADVDDAYQLFANGDLLGSFGDFSGASPKPYFSQPMQFPIHLDPGASPTLVLVFRVWLSPYGLAFTPDTGGLHTAPLLGSVPAVAAVHQIQWLNVIRVYAGRPLEALLFLLLSVVAFSLLLFDRTDRVYLWIGAVFFLTALVQVLVVIGSMTQFIAGRNQLLFEDICVVPFLLSGWVMVWWVWFRLDRPAWLPKAVAVLTLLYMVSLPIGEQLFVGTISHSVSDAFHIVSLSIRLVLLVLLISNVVQGIRRQGFEGWLVLAPVILTGPALFRNELNALHIRGIWFPFGLQMTLADLGNFLLAAAIALLLLRRLLHNVRDQRRLALDVKQAQEVQQVILPEARTVLPGFTVESEYRPALEVGGDFFQIIPNPSDGSLLIVAGDVTGKGLKAGMLVALLVGATRSTAESTTDPGAILEALNRRLLGRGEAHATCLALRFDVDGVVSLANAGHMPPYLNGQPLPIEGALPLGMTSATNFSSMRFTLSAGDRLVVISDGIVEATDGGHQLFGFERAQHLLNTAASAADLAATAQSWGQQDDISVISVTRTPVFTLTAV